MLSPKAQIKATQPWPYFIHLVSASKKKDELEATLRSSPLFDAYLKKRSEGQASGVRGETLATEPIKPAKGPTANALEKGKGKAVPLVLDVSIEK